MSNPEGSSRRALALEHVIVVLVRPQHPGNVGATCRAMKNMGLSRLRLVQPPPLDPEGPAAWMATHATDLLEAAEVFDCLEDALTDVSTVIGTTARIRHGKYPTSEPRALGAYLEPRLAQGSVALLFGQEDHGLDNDAISHCELLIRIPTMEMASLNLSQAVLLIGYELMRAGRQVECEDERILSTVADRERLVTALVGLSRRVEYLRGRDSAQLQAFFRGMLGRLALDGQEVGIVMGLIRKIRWHLEHPGGGPGEES